jgi:hypothetical protein
VPAVGVDIEPPPRGASPGGASGGFSAQLLLAVTLAAGAFLILMPALLLVVHPVRPAFAEPAIIGQNQTAKSALYVVTFLVLLPLSLFAAAKLDSRIADGAGPDASRLVAVVLLAGLAVALIAARLLPGGLASLLSAMAVWWLLAGGVLVLATSDRSWPAAARMAQPLAAAPAIGALALLGVVLCVTHLSGLSGLGLAVGVLAAAGALLAYGRIRVPRPGPGLGIALDLVAVAVLLLAVPDVVIYKTGSGIPSIYFPPGVIQFQQDWLLGPANQLLGGGALLVNVPSSQYGVGLIYFLAGWFHLVPIGYGMLGLLDGILTAVFYATGYCVLRIAGTGRLLACGALAFAVVVFLYDLPYSVGALPEQGPLRFGLPMVVILAAAAGSRFPRWIRPARVIALLAVGISSVWALEAFAYTTFTILAVLVVGAVLRPPSRRRAWFLRQLGLVVAACLGAQLLLALLTLAGSGYLPHWSQYLAYVHGLLLGGREGSTTYGFARWSPGLAMGAVCLASAAALVLVVLRARSLLVREPPRFVALAGLTAYAVASFSYTDNRSSTYLLLYVALPVLMIVVLWLGLLLSPERRFSTAVRRSSLGLVTAAGALMLAAAWPAIGTHFSDSALAHAYPGGGLRAAVHRLAHPPPIDPRAPEVERLLARYVAGKRVIVLFEGSPDLALEAMMRTGRRNALFIGDASEDVWIPSVWVPRIQSQLGRLRAGQRLLLDDRALRVIAQLRGRPAGYAIAHQTIGLNGELAWILHQLDLRFKVEPIHRDSEGFVVAQLAPRGA